MTVVGCRRYDFEDRETGRQVSGLSVFYTASSNDGETKGQVADKLNVKAGTMAYNKLLAANFDKPFMADATFEILPGSKRAVLTDFAF